MEYFVDVINDNGNKDYYGHDYKHKAITAKLGTEINVRDIIICINSKIGDEFAVIHIYNQKIYESVKKIRS